MEGTGNALYTARSSTALGDGMTICTGNKCKVPNAAAFFSHTHIHKHALATKALSFFVVWGGSPAMVTQICTRELNAKTYTHI
jgi:hypothetical protein